MNEWMKLELNTPSKRQIFAMARALKKSTNEVLGACVRLWCWCDANCVDGNTGMDTASIEEVVCLKGFVRAMAAVAWCKVSKDADGAEVVLIANFDEHNGHTAKKRAETNRRVARHRKKGNAAETQAQQECNAASVSSALQKALPEEEIDIDKEKALLSECSKESSAARPQSVEEVLAVMKNAPNAGLPPTELAFCAQKFMDEMQAQGWVRANGRTVEDWRAAARAYQTSWMQRMSQPRFNGGMRGAAQGGTKRRKDCNDPNDYR